MEEWADRLPRQKNVQIVEPDMILSKLYFKAFVFFWFFLFFMNKHNIVHKLIERKGLVIFKTFKRVFRVL